MDSEQEDSEVETAVPRAARAHAAVFDHKDIDIVGLYSFQSNVVEDGNFPYIAHILIK